jgi:hypothetical protein
MNLLCSVADPDPYVFGLPDPLVPGTDQDPAPEPSVISDFYFMKNDDV